MRPISGWRDPISLATVCLCLSGCLCLAGLLAGASQPAAGSVDAVPATGVRASSGGGLPVTLVPAIARDGLLAATLSGDAITLGGDSRGRGVLVGLPPGTEEIALNSIAILDGEGRALLDPAVVTLGPRMILRGRAVVPLVITDARALRRIAAAGGRVEIRFDAAGAGSALSGAAPQNDGPTGIWAPARQRVAAAGMEGGMDHRGVYLIVTAPELVDALDPLIAWKTRMGYEVHLATTVETGTSREAIRDYIRTAYETWDQPPLYVLLVGDADGALNLVPAWDVSGNVSDHPYACVDGDDFLPDLFVGRFAAKYPSEVELQVAKTIGYESAPDTTGDAGWFTRALLTAGNYNASTPVALSRWVGEELRGIGYTQIDSVYWSDSPDHPWWNGDALIKYFVDRGVGIINYRGWAMGDRGWQPPTYIDDDVRELQNGWRMPVVFSIVCHTGNFGNVDMDCFGEAWMKTGTVAEPQGAVGFIGTGEHWSHSRWNDRLAMGIFEEICHAGEHELGRMLAGSKLRLIEHFPTELRTEDALDDEREECVEYYMHTYNLLGDPSLAMWTARPAEMTLTVIEGPSSGRNFLIVEVTDGSGVPVAAAHVALTRNTDQNTALIGYAPTDASGIARVWFTPAGEDTIHVQVTGTNRYPLSAALAIEAEEHAVTVTAAACTGGGGLLPGASTEVTLTLTNTGTAVLDGATLTITGPGDDPTVVATTSIGALAPGGSGTASDALALQAAADTEDGRRLRYLCTPTIAGIGELTPSEFRLAAGAPRFVCRRVSDGGDEIFDPGETVELVVTLANEGSAAAGALTAELAPVVPGFVALVDSVAGFAEIAPGAEASNDGEPFVIQVGATVPGGTVIPLVLEVSSADGPKTNVACNLVVGPHDPSVPVGPDTYGYYGYDSADFDYPGQAPVYAWVECSPLFGGAGTELEEIYDNKHSQIVGLPFTFTYYGVPYDTIRVSDNGWMSFDTDYWYDIRNWNMPDVWGGASMVAPFWDNLDPGIPGSDGIYAWHDQERHCLVVEWSRLQNWEETTDDYQTFEVLLRDPSHYPTESGDGELIFQYKQIVNDDYTRMYATVGIEDHTEERGLVYSFSNQYATGAAPLSAGLAIKFTTTAPVYEPLATGHFTAHWHPRPGVGPQVEACWALTDQRPLAGLELYRAAESEGLWGAETKVHDGMLAAGCERFVDHPEVAHSGGEAARCRYRLVAVDGYGNRRTVGETYCEPGGPAAALVGLTAGAIAGGRTEIRYELGGASLEELSVYDLTGRMVADLRRGLPPAALSGAASGSLVWEGRDERGRRLPSGVYWLRLRTPQEIRRARILLVH
ncbi:MAG: hypothetical protein KAY32_11445 [Candidatus Eisenbacteria sp.]|nr:hypothetical protein [Candidatus Eisenbacteria bacterium]